MVGHATKKEERWKIVPACIWWTVWKERNRRCFEDKYCNLQELKMNCLALYYFWCKQKILAQTEEIFDVLDYLQVFTSFDYYVSCNTFEGTTYFDVVYLWIYRLILPFSKSKRMLRWMCEYTRRDRIQK